MSKRLNDFKKDILGLSAQDILVWVMKTFGWDRCVIASSFGLEDQVLTDMVLNVDEKARIFTLDTGRLFQETYDTMQASVDKYGISYEIYVPEEKALAELLKEDGPNLFYKNIENRKDCCSVRKMEPLKRALATSDIWVTGLRAKQSVTRTDLDVLEWDKGHSLYKLNPLLAWTEEEAWTYVKKNNVPYNVLHDQGFPSLGCAPCTRAVKPGEDIRAGRWWWEQPDEKECGLHVKDGKLQRKRL